MFIAAQLTIIRMQIFGEFLGHFISFEHNERVLLARFLARPTRVVHLRVRTTQVRAQEELQVLYMVGTLRVPHRDIRQVSRR